MLRQRLISEKYTYSPYKKTENKPIISEWKLSLCGLVFSLFVIITKLYYSNLDSLKKLVFEEHLISYEIINENGEIMLKYAWTGVVKYSNIWLPALCGFITMYFTWMIVYLDSHVPGIQPPSPFSPTKYKTKSGHSFHLNYLFAIFMGLMVAIYMYWKNISIEYIN